MSADFNGLRREVEKQLKDLANLKILKPTMEKFEFNYQEDKQNFLNDIKSLEIKLKIL